MQAWKQRLYASYVSSGQGGSGASSGFEARQPYIEQVIARHVPQDRAARIFDAGCGDGVVLFFLKKAGYGNIAGVDVSAEMVALAHGAGLPEVFQGELLPALEGLAVGSLDVLFIMDVLEHLEREELFAVCDAARQALKSGGRLILHVPNSTGVFGDMIRYGDLTHELSFNSSSMRQLLATTGFGAMTCYEEKPVVHGLKSLVRAVLWEIGSFGHRVLNLAETGSWDVVLTRNMLVVADAR
jgi:2-polyprenyl-3-methyl-5-hydroxy-6-metoxy-1,4-benzoquinol methylase